MAEKQFDRKGVIAMLTKSVHGDLQSYVLATLQAIDADAEFVAHLTRWNHAKGQVRDAKIALPVATLLNRQQPSEFIENALALLADLPPRMFEQALAFAKSQRAPDRLLRRLVERYLREKEVDRREWDRVALQHRDTMRSLYGRYHVAPGGKAGSYEDLTLMRHQAEKGKFAVVRTLATLPAQLIGNAVKTYRLPFLVVRGALGPRAQEQDVALALLQAMTANELVTNTRALQRMGIKTDPVLRAAYEQKIAELGTKPQKKGKTATLKTTRAAEALKADGDEVLASKLHAAQERQLQQLGGIDGDWLVLGDRSPSMREAIDVAMQICGVLSRMVSGKVHLVLFDEMPKYYDMTGLTYEQVKDRLKNVSLGSATSCGVGLDYLITQGLTVDGIAIVSDGGHNRQPDFSTAYAKYVKKFETEPTVYFYDVPGDRDVLSPELDRAKVQYEKFDLRKQTIDYYSLPNLVQTMRVNRYSLADEIAAMPLATLDQVLPKTKGMEVMARGGVVTA